MLEIKNIGKVFNPHRRNKNQVLNDVSFKLPDKGLICIYGKSGSGKTTLLNIIGGLEKQDSGKILIDGLDTSKNVDKIRNQNIGFVFQNYYLESGYTIEEIMHNAMVIAGFKDEEEIKRRTHEVLDLVDMERFKHKQGDSLSGGQKQRVAIARGLIKGADILLADEPTGNLDAENTFKIMDIFKEISKTHLVLIVTHEVTLIKKYADSYIELLDGKLTDKDLIGEVYKYETLKNSIFIDKEKVKNDNSLNINTYGKPVLNKDDLNLYEKDGKLYLTCSKKIQIINENSEKKIVFEDEALVKSNGNGKVIPHLEKCQSKHNGKLFNFKNIFRSLKNTSDERAYSTSNIFKQIFIAMMSFVMVFFSMMAFEVLNTTNKNKVINDDNYYVNLNSFSEIKKLDQNLYDKVDFFETKYRTGSFSYRNFTALSGVEALYAPKAIENDFDKALLIGRMPRSKEILITTALAEELQSNFRIKELNNLKAMLQVFFEQDYQVVGIVKDKSPLVYMVKEDYVNFLGVYDSLEFIDPNEIFFTKDFIKNTYKTEIRLMDESEFKNISEVEVSLSRNALYKMVDDTTQADFKVQKANSVLRSNKGETALQIKNSNLYVKKLSITRDPIKADICIYLHPKALENIFAYLEPNIDALRLNKESDSKFYFELETKDLKQKEDLKNYLDSEGIFTVDINKAYKYEAKNNFDEAIKSLNIFLIIMVLLFIIYYFIEKSGSLKNSKEYGIYRAIGVNKSNLLFKETINTLMNNLITYLISFIIITLLICIRYLIMNISIWMFVLIALVVFIISAFILLGISLIPYLFVIRDTPSKILSRYDI